MEEKAEKAAQSHGVDASSDTAEVSGFWWKFWLIYLAGVTAATSMGKITPVSVEMREDMSLSLSQVALIASLVTAVAAVLGLLVSYLLRPFDPRRMLVGGLVVMGVAGLFCAHTGSFGTLLGGRLLESVGYVIVVIVAPVLLFGLGSGSRLTSALAIWGTFMPVGLAVGSFAGGVLSTWFDWQGWLTIAGAATLAVAVATTRLPGDIAGRRPAPVRVRGDAGTVRRRAELRRRTRRLARPLALGAAFATISGAIVTCVTLYPTYLHEEFDVPTETAGTLTGIVSFVGVAGGFLASALLRRGKDVKYLFLVALLMPAAAFAAFGGVGGTAGSVSGALVVALSNELVVASVFAAIPLAVRATSDMDAANGLVAQLGSIGALAAPPLVGLAVTAADGWWAVGPCLLVGCGAGTVLLCLAAREGGEEGRKGEEERMAEAS
ncbi:MFS transporter [Streptomyces flavofungini]|uniref:MFS transporter n=1 Tax=Streptomyces flavofungini TaxID=68200 RepID=A0ABS0X7E4_9ACTN|nr:MFS transporter [Streptomyces flavofungini]MBJ3809128.1 MFS transporter [Streptomyces flavofungini]GHC68687.1 MFS transporter [Streptomyces flavofungini]